MDEGIIGLVGLGGALLGTTLCIAMRAEIGVDKI